MKSVEGTTGIKEAWTGTPENHTEEAGERLPCSQCDKTFKNKNSLDKHVKNIHSKKGAKNPVPDPEPGTSKE